MQPSKTNALTAEDVRNCTFTFSHWDGPYRVSIGRGAHPRTGVAIEVMQREFVQDQQLQDLNTAERNIMDTRRWSSGSGSDKGGNMPLVHVARTPLAKWFADVGTKLKTEGEEYQRHWLNDEKNAAFRTRSGKL